ENIVQAGGLSEIKQELNSYPLYTRMVRLFGFKEIGIIATDDRGKESGRYASLNNERGEITDIVTEFANPCVIVQAKEKYLMEILQRVDWVKAHPFQAIAQYGLRFSLVQGSYKNIPAYVAHFFGNIAKIELHNPRSSI
ncbi:MAG: hypothetical protein Q7K45_01020, partial [Nanoarchaeota archaeon]|nr:hypothetical protein [Nanoarchaeota archaeon]